jgi:hypothetical protein
MAKEKDYTSVLANSKCYARSGDCEDNCPFGVEVRANMANAMELFGQ